MARHPLRSGSVGIAVGGLVASVALAMALLQPAAGGPTADSAGRGAPAQPLGAPAGNNHPFVITSGASGGVCWVDVWLRIDPGLTELYLVKGGQRTDLTTQLQPVPPVAVVAGGAAPTPVSLALPIVLGIHDGFTVRWTGQPIGAPHFLDADHVGLYLRAGGKKAGNRYRRPWANPPMNRQRVTLGFSYKLSPLGVERTVEREVDGAICGGDEATPPASVTPPTPATPTDVPTLATPPTPTDTPPTPETSTFTPTPPTPETSTFTPTPPTPATPTFTPTPPTPATPTFTPTPPTPATPTFTPTPPTPATPTFTPTPPTPATPTFTPTPPTPATPTFTPTPPTPATRTFTPTPPTPATPTFTSTPPTPATPTFTPTPPTPATPTFTPTPPTPAVQRIYVPKPYLPVPVTRRIYVPKPFLPQPATRRILVPHPFLPQR